MNNTELNIKLGMKIKEYRKKFNFTQEVFSEKIGRTQRQVSLLELGKSFPSPDTLIKIADTFKCQIKDLFDFETVENIHIIKSELINMIDNYPENKLKILYLIGKHL